MFKKLASLFIAATMLIGTAAVSVSAAEVDSDAVAADSASGEVAADSASDSVAADSDSSSTAAGNIIKFDVKSSGWGNVKTVFCHVWKADGSKNSQGKDWPAWQARAERCDYDAAAGIATYDLSKADPGISKSDGKIYCVIFSVNTGMQTYNAIMSGSCIGDTLYCTGKTLENPEDSEKTAIEAAWRNNPSCGPEKKITSTGKVVGSAFPDGENNTTLVATYVMAYYADPAKMELLQGIVNELNVSPVDVMSVVKARVTDDPKKVSDIEKILSELTDPTKGGAKVDKKDLENAQASSSGSGSTGGGSTGGTGSVSSGVETTVLFVLGGLMIAAAGVAFLARKKREF